MGLFNIFKKKEDSDKKANLKTLMDDMQNKMFPGGKQQIVSQTQEVKNLLDNRYDESSISGVLCYMTTLLFISEDKSANRIVRHGAMLKPDNRLTESDAMIIYKYVVRKQYEKAFGSYYKAGFEEFYQSLGNVEGGATTDVIPRAYGEYGLCVNNPIPVCGIPANEIYLKKLSLISGEGFTWKRIGSTGASNIKMPIDMYQITSDNGEDLCVIYISPYQSITSNKAPKGFFIKES